VIRRATTPLPNSGGSPYTSSNSSHVNLCNRSRRGESYSSILTSNYSSRQAGHLKVENISIAIGIQQDVSVDSDRSVEDISLEESNIVDASDPQSPFSESEATIDPDAVWLSIEDTTNITAHYPAEYRSTGRSCPSSPTPYEGSSVEPQLSRRNTASASALALSETRSSPTAPDAVDTKTARSLSRMLSGDPLSVPTVGVSSVLEADNTYEEDNSHDKTYIDSEQTDSSLVQSDEGDSASIQGEEDIEGDSDCNEKEESID